MVCEKIRLACGHLNVPQFRGKRKIKIGTLFYHESRDISGKKKRKIYINILISLKLAPFIVFYCLTIFYSS